MHLHFGWPQTVMALWFLLVVALNASHHGKPRTGIHNGWTGVTVMSLIYGILFWGGFFS